MAKAGRAIEIEEELVRPRLEVFDSANQLVSLELGTETGPGFLLILPDDNKVTNHLARTDEPVIQVKPEDRASFASREPPIRYGTQALPLARLETASVR